MGWKTHTPDMGRRPGEGWSRVTVGLVKRAFQPPYLQVTMKREAWEELGFAPNDRVTVLIGTGEHAGRIRLNKSPDGSCELRSRRIAKSKDGQALLVANLGRFDGLPDKPIKAIGADYEKLDHAYVEIILPDWSTIPAKPVVTQPPRDMSPKAVHGRLMGRPGQ